MNKIQNLQLQSGRTKISPTKPVSISMADKCKCQLEVNIPPEKDINISSVLHAKNSEAYELNYSVQHIHPNTSSHSEFRAVLEDQAIFRLQGMIHVKMGAINTKAYLLIKVLVLSSTTQVKITPSLEIKENDVKVSHGATISQISQEDYFYLESRGLPTKLAKKMIVKGFLSQ